jgi:hypothetical protein
MKNKLKREIYNIFSDIIYIFLILIIVYKINNINEYKILDNPYLNDILSNWSTKPIHEIYLAKNDETCEKNFLNYEWEGVPFSCDCKNSHLSSVKGNIYKGQCDNLKILLGCFTIKNIKSITTTKWKNAKICLIEHYIDYSKTLTILGNRCPKKYINCGKDTKNFSICFPKMHGCPVNYLKFSTSDKKYSEKYTRTVKLNDDWFIHYSNRYTNNSIITEIKYSEGRICVNPAEKNIKNSHLKYKVKENFNKEKEKENSYEDKKIRNLEKKRNFNPHNYCITQIGRNNFDDRYIFLDSNSKFRFYSDNNLNEKIENLPNLNSQDLITQTSNLYYRSFIHWSPFCRQDENLNPMAMIKDIFELIVVDSFFPFIQYYLFILIAVSLILLSFSIIDVFFFDNNNYTEKENKNNLNDSKSKDNNNYNSNRTLITFENLKSLKDKIIFIFAKILLFSTGALIFVIIFNIYLSEKLTPIIIKFSNQKCGDLITNETFDSIARYLGLIILNNYYVLFFAIIMFGVLVLKNIL